MKITTDILQAALAGLEKQRDDINTKIAEINAELRGKPVARPVLVKATAAATVPKAKRKMSSAARKRIGDAARKRWAALRKEKAKAA